MLFRWYDKNPKEPTWTFSCANFCFSQGFTGFIRHQAPLEADLYLSNVLVRRSHGNRLICRWYRCCAAGWLFDVSSEVSDTGKDFVAIETLKFRLDLLEILLILFNQIFDMNSLLQSLRAGNAEQNVVNFVFIGQLQESITIILFDNFCATHINSCHWLQHLWEFAIVCTCWLSWSLGNWHQASPAAFKVHVYFWISAIKPSAKNFSVFYPLTCHLGWWLLF